MSLRREIKYELTAKFQMSLRGLKDRKTLNSGRLSTRARVYFTLGGIRAELWLSDFC